MSTTTTSNAHTEELLKRFDQRRSLTSEQREAFDRERAQREGAAMFEAAQRIQRT